MHVLDRFNPPRHYRRPWSASFAFASVIACTSVLHAQSTGEVTRLPVLTAEAPATCPPPDGTRPDPTLVNTDPAVLSRFALSRVYQQLLTTSGGASSSEQLYQSMWDALDTSSNAKFPGAHCDDDGTAINGFPIDCPRPERTLKDTTPDAFVPVALFNRFDLAPADGSNCGEYRIIYALGPSSGVSGRTFLIFEAALPNPQPSCGLEACRPVVDFWESLATRDQNTLADELDRFYFDGLAGFRPVVHPANYGDGGAGQIRANLFVDFELWQLREFHLVRQCDGAACDLRLQPVTVKTNPFAPLFNPENPSADPRATAFHSAFPAQARALSNDDVAQISMRTEDRFNSGQSTSQNSEESYDFQLGLGDPSNVFTSAIETQLASIERTDLTATDIARRATTQSCAGCHQLSNGVELGGLTNPRWPASRGFVHVDEEGFLSEALWCSFLPARKGVLDGFAASPALECSPMSTVVVDDEAVLPLSNRRALTVSGRNIGPN